MTLRRSLVLAIAFVGGFGGACGGSSNSAAPGGAGAGASDGGAPASNTGGLPCAVDDVLARTCRTCHSDPPQFGAPVALTTWAGLHAASTREPSKYLYQAVSERIADDVSPMPPSPSPRLSDADRKTLTDWAAAGAPASTEACTTAPPATTTPTSATCTGADKISLAASASYTMPAAEGDQYICWGVDIAKNPAQQITSFSPRIDNTTIVHHVVMYESPNSYPSTPTPCSAAAALTWRMVFGWAPGVKSLELPPDVGFPIGTTTPSHYVVVMHYSNPQHLAGQSDTSGFDLCTGPPRANEADVLAFGTETIHIPAQPPAGGVYELACSLTMPADYAGLHLIAAMPHMHKLGVEMSTTLAPKAGGAAVDLGTMPKYSFEAQAWLPLNAVTAAGDVVTTTCGWTNTTGAPVNFGENTSDEMCYSFTMYYPRITAAYWSWAIPTTPPPIGATCIAK